MKRLNKLIFLSLLVSTGLALSVLELSIPIPLPIPGAKLGLSNMVVLITIILFGFEEGLTVAGLKSILLMLVTGSVSGFLYSFSGAILSSIVMYLSYRYLSRVFSLIGVSILGALAHNFAQVTVAVIILNNLRVYTYGPLLMIMSLFSGYFVGLSSKYIIKNLEKNFKLIFQKQV